MGDSRNKRILEIRQRSSAGSEEGRCVLLGKRTNDSHETMHNRPSVFLLVVVV